MYILQLAFDILCYNNIVDATYLSHSLFLSLSIYISLSLSISLSLYIYIYIYTRQQQLNKPHVNRSKEHDDRLATCWNEVD